MYDHGVIVGKFYPPHAGHDHLIRTACAQVRKLSVLVCSRDDQTIPGELRGAWLREIHPDVEVLVIPDDLPDDDSAAWAENTIRWLGRRPDAAFTSEDYGDAFAHHLGCDHVLVDKDRSTVPCSGSAVRFDPYAMWPFLAPCVRAYFAKRVVVLGAESTGTTTLAMALAEHYDTTWVPEYGREYSIAKMDCGDVEWHTSEFVQIAEEQSRREDLAARDANRLLICDTDAFTTCLWHERYIGYWSPEVAKVADRRHPDLYLLTDVDIPFVQDGYRDGEHIRDDMHKRFLEELQVAGTPFAVLSGSHDNRLDAATRLTDRLLAPYCAP